MREYRDTVHQIHIVNGAEGDGGVSIRNVGSMTYIGVQEVVLEPLDSDKSTDSLLNNRSQTSSSGTCQIHCMYPQEPCE